MIFRISDVPIFDVYLEIDRKMYFPSSFHHIDEIEEEIFYANV